MYMIFIRYAKDSFIEDQHAAPSAATATPGTVFFLTPDSGNILSTVFDLLAFALFLPPRPQAWAADVFGHHPTENPEATLCATEAGGSGSQRAGAVSPSSEGSGADHGD
jgi:hypothetical protein